MTTYTIEFRRGLAADWTSVNPVLHNGEPGFEIDTNKIKIGDGVAAWADLSYLVDPVLIQELIDAAAVDSQAYTDAAVATEATARTAAITAEATARANADSTLTTAVSNEIAARTAADAATLAAAEAYTDAHTFVRTTATKTTASLAAQARELSTITLTKSYRVLRVTTNYPARVRLYTEMAKRNSDAARAIGEEPTGNHGLVMDVVTTASVLFIDTSPTVDGYDVNNNGIIGITIDNLDTVARAITATLTYVRTE